MGGTIIKRVSQLEFRILSMITFSVALRLKVGQAFELNWHFDPRLQADRDLIEKITLYIFLNKTLTFKKR